MVSYTKLGAQTGFAMILLLSNFIAGRPKAGWSDGAMVLGKLSVPGRPTILITVGQGPIALAVGAGGVVWTLLLSSILSPLSPSLWETARYRLKYCLKGPLNPKQPTNQTVPRRLLCFGSLVILDVVCRYLS